MVWHDRSVALEARRTEVRAEIPHLMVPVAVAGAAPAGFNKRAATKSSPAVAVVVAATERRVMVATEETAGATARPAPEYLPGEPVLPELPVAVAVKEIPPQEAPAPVAVVALA